MHTCPATSSTLPPVWTRPSCPRCDGEHITSLDVTRDSIFAWHECRDCRHLWAVPSGWSPYGESSLR